MIVMQPGEQVLCDVKRHPIGIIGSYVGAFLGIALIVVLAALLVPKLAEQYTGTANVQAIGYGVAAILGIFIIVALFISTVVYWQNRWVVTSDSITQISQRSLFGRQVSQLSMNNLEDVTVDQHGIFPTMFGYGTLKVETAGERSKFFFTYCPKPNDVARQILEARERFEQQNRGGESHGVNYIAN